MGSCYSPDHDSCLPMALRPILDAASVRSAPGIGACGLRDAGIPLLQAILLEGQQIVVSCRSYLGCSFPFPSVDFSDAIGQVESWAGMASSAD